MPGYPCCCLAPQDGIWDLYYPFFLPRLLDMGTTIIQDPNRTLYVRNSNFFDFLGINLNDDDFTRSLYTVNRPEMFQSERLDQKIPTWYIPHLSFLSSETGYRAYNGWFDFDLFLKNSALTNIRDSSEKTIFSYTSPVLGSTGTFDMLSSGDFNVYKQEFSNYGYGYPTSLGRDWWSFKYGTQVAVSHTGIRHIDLMPILYSGDITDYTENVNPTFNEKYYDIFGVGDDYVGTTAQYNITGDYRYSLDQPFYTGLPVNVLETTSDRFYSGFFNNPSVLGYDPNYSILPQTGVYIDTFSYFASGTNNNTGIRDTGNFDFALGFLLGLPKVPPPLIAPMSLNESFIDTKRTYDGNPRSQTIEKVSIIIKPGELRSFFININNTDDVPGPYYLQYALPGQYQINFGATGELSYSITDIGSSTQRYHVFESFCEYTIDSSGYYHIDMYRSLEKRINTNLEFPEFTGQDPFANLASGNVFNPSDASVFVSQTQSLINTRNSTLDASGYLPYRDWSDRTIAIQPFNVMFVTFVSDRWPGYFGSSGDGFWFKEATYSLLDREHLDIILNTNVANKTFAYNNTDPFINEWYRITDDIRAAGNSEGGYYNVPYLPFPSVVDYPKRVPSIITYDSTGTAICSINTVRSRPLASFNRGIRMFISDLLSYVIVTGVTDTFQHQFARDNVIYQKFNISNTFDTSKTAFDLNFDPLHWVDKLSLRDLSALNTLDINPAILNKDQQKHLVVQPDTSCWPIIYSTGLQINQTSIDTPYISWDYYLSNDCDVVSIEKFSRSGTATGGFSGAPYVASNFTHADSLIPIDFLVPQASTYIGTTTIYRDPNGSYANDGTGIVTTGNYLDDYVNTSNSGSLFAIYLDPSNTYQTINPIYSPGTGYFYNPVPNFIDGFVADFDPFIRPILPAILQPGNASGIGTGQVPPASPNDDPYIDYITSEFNIEGYDSNNWCAISFNDPKIQSNILPDESQYSVYGDNYAFCYVEEAVETQRRHSFKVNGNYIFQNITGFPHNNFTFKVGPNNLVYILRGEIVGTGYFPYPNTAVDWARVGNNIVDPPSGIINKTADMIIADLNGTTLWTFPLYNSIPDIIGMTDNHFYVRGLYMPYLLNPAQMISSDALSIVDFVNTTGGFYDVLLGYSGSVGTHDAWRFSYQPSGFISPLTDTFTTSNLASDDLPLFGDSALTDDFSDLELFYDKIMITNNSDITETPSVNSQFPINWREKDITLKGYVWTGSFYDDDFDILINNGWTAGSSGYIDEDELRLTSFPSTGHNEFYIYKNVPVTVGTPYILQAYVRSFNVNEPFDIRITHEGVTGQGGSPVATRFIHDAFGIAYTDSGLDYDAQVARPGFGNPRRTTIRMQYTPTVVGPTGSQNIKFEVLSTGVNTYNYTGVVEPTRPVLQIEGIMLYEGYSGNPYPDIQTTFSHPLLLEFN